MFKKTPGPYHNDRTTGAVGIGQLRGALAQHGRETVCLRANSKATARRRRLGERTARRTIGRCAVAHGRLEALRLGHALDAIRAVDICSYFRRKRIRSKEKMQ